MQMFLKYRLALYFTFQGHDAVPFRKRHPLATENDDVQILSMNETISSQFSPLCMSFLTL